MFDATFLFKYWPILMLSSVFICLFALERTFPLRTASHPGFKRVLTNIIMTVLVIAVVKITVLPTVRFTMLLSHSHHIGLLPFFNIHGWYAFVMGFLLLDLSFYYWHRLNHRIAILWRFHNVHHVDQDLDVTTAMRFHWGEIAYSSFFRFVQLILIGVPFLTLLVYELIFQLCTFFHHSNIRLPKQFEKLLGYLMITPRAHGIHHSNYRQETDSNYGVVFSVWDRFHRSLNLSVHQKDITIGVPAYPYEQDNRLKTLLFLPFCKQRNYWTTPDNRSHEKRKKSNPLS